MSADRDDRDAEDPQLKALRAVWLEMRDADEDPPTRGLDALMAAARSQAAQLAPAAAPWWKRMLEQLRRPPVLALATIMLMIGGAVLITNRDTIEKAQTTAPPPPPRESEAPAANKDVSGPASGAGAPDPRGAMAPGGQAPAAASSPATPTSSTPTATPAAPPPPVRHAPSPGRPAAHGAATAVPSSSEDGFGASEAQTLDAKKAPAHDEGDADTAITGAAPKAAATKADAAPKATAQTRAPQKLLVDQLASQARGAARRGDCETARSIGARIARQDAAYYQEHVASDLAGCLEPPKAAAPAKQ